MENHIGRRAFFALPVLARGGAAHRDHVPTDLDRLNQFAAAYNLYAEQLRRGIVDVKLWRKTAVAWQALGKA